MGFTNVTGYNTVNDIVNPILSRFCEIYVPGYDYDTKEIINLHSYNLKFCTGFAIIDMKYQFWVSVRDGNPMKVSVNMDSIARRLTKQRRVRKTHNAKIFKYSLCLFTEFSFNVIILSGIGRRAKLYLILLVLSQKESSLEDQLNTSLGEVEGLL